MMQSNLVMKYHLMTSRSSLTNEVSPNEDAVKSDHEVSFDNIKTDPHAKYTHNRLHGQFAF